MNNEMKSFVRDLNLNLLTNKHEIGIDLSRRYNNKIRWFMPSRKLINYIIKSGGILTGSRALRCYKINDKFILDRPTKDWDFVITQEMAFKICDNFNIGIIPDVDKVISIDNQRYWRHPDYMESYRVGPVDVQLIIKDELPEYKTIDRINISSFQYIINEKMKLIDGLAEKVINSSSISDERKELGKHLDDMTQIIIKFNCVKNTKTYIP
jgi:hypothetical protein